MTVETVMNSDDIILAAPPLPILPVNTVPPGEEEYEETMALRWRSAILRLSETFMDAADERSDLSPYLLEAMHNALNNLLVYGEADDLMVLEEWLSMEDDYKVEAVVQDIKETAHKPRGADRRQGDRRVQFVFAPIERRAAPRRTGERRAIKDWQFEAIPHSPLDTPETVEG